MMLYLVQQYFTHSVQTFPNKVAVSCESESITYQELDAFSNAFARNLSNKGVKRGELIAFFMKKSVNAIKSILSILKADCAYIPIDVNSPAQRLASILGASSARVVIVDDESEQQLKSLISTNAYLCDSLIIVNINSVVSQNTQHIEYKNLSIDLAYVLFTSGSTGVPKGVMIPHKAIIDYIDWCVDTYKITSDDVISNHAPLYFDNSTFDLYTAFKVGATLHLVHDELNAVIPRLASWIKEREISIFFCVPSVLTMLLKSRRLKPDSMKSLRHLICAGEVLPAQTLSAWMELYPHICYTNMYGPTEITVDCSYYTQIDKLTDQDLSIPIGKARKNMELFIRTEDGTLTQQSNIQGELLVRGTSVAYGYLGDKEKTQAAFIQNPAHNLYHDLLYCTGDLVKINKDGDFLFMGRADDQIKYLGYRIELGEIEASLNSITHVEECVVVFKQGGTDSDSQIGALVSLSNDFTLTQLNEQIKQMLPAYMVPSIFIESTTEFLRTPNGKYDRKNIAKEVFREP